MSTSTISRRNLTRSRSTGSGSSENLPPRILARVGKEVRTLFRDPPEGVRLVVDQDTGLPDNLSEIVAEIAGPVDTPYEGKFFQLKLHLPSDFPTSPPRGFFLTKIYHPNVDPSNGAICVNTLKRDWSKDTSFSHILSVIRCLLIIPFAESSLNDEAGKLFMEDYDEYAERARLMAEVHAIQQPSSLWNIETGKESKLGDNEEGKSQGQSMQVRRSKSSSSVMVDIDGNGRTLQRKDSRRQIMEKKNKKKSLRRL